MIHPAIPRLLDKITRAHRAKDSAALETLLEQMSLAESMDWKAGIVHSAAQAALRSLDAEAVGNQGLADAACHSLDHLEACYT